MPFIKIKVYQQLDRTWRWSVKEMPLPTGWFNMHMPHIGFPEISFVVCNFSHDFQDSIL